MPGYQRHLGQTLSNLDVTCIQAGQELIEFPDQALLALHTKWKKCTQNGKMGSEEIRARAGLGFALTWFPIL